MPFDPYHTWLGIPPEEQPPNRYRLLALPAFEDDPAAVEHAADQRMVHLRTLQAGKHLRPNWESAVSHLGVRVDVACEYCPSFLGSDI